MDSLEAFTALQEVLVEFRAGKMNMEGKRVIPDSRKGLVRVGRGQEGLVHFQWLDRTLNAVEDDQIVFPEDAIFEKVEQASGRVYLLKFHADDRKLFFWMQEPSGENDVQICNSVNFYLNLPIEFGDEDNDASGALLQTSEDMVEEDISSRAGNLVGPSMGEVTSDVTSSGPVKLSDLQRILSNIGSSEEVVDLDPDGGLGLSDILKPELIFPLFESLPLEQRLGSYLPGGQWTSELDLMEIIQSPPFRQQVDSFTYVLRTGQIDLTQFGVDPSKYKFTVLSFLEALEDSVLKITEESSRSQSVNQQSEPMDEAH